MKTKLETTPLVDLANAPKPTRQGNNDQAALKKKCQDFEAIFIQSMFKAMRKTVPEGGLFPKSNATDTFLDMFDQEIAANVSRRQSPGLAEQMYRQIEKNRTPRK